MRKNVNPDDPGTWPVLSVGQPWAHAIMYYAKDVENRSWSTTYRGRMWVHASSRGAFLDRWPGTVALGGEHGMPIGVIVGSVDITDVVRGHTSPWSWGPDLYQWVVSDPRPLDVPIPAKGLPTLWYPRHEVADALRAVAMVPQAPWEP